jgi:hypothetical protein
MTSNPLRNHTDFEFSFPHKPECFVYRRAESLIGVDRTGLCTCDAERRQRELESAMVDLMRAKDERGLLIRLGGDVETVVRNFRELAAKLVAGHVGMPDSATVRINDLRNLEMLARVYRLLLEGMPRHSSSCSNQNVVDPLGAYRGASRCGCNHG